MTARVRLLGRIVAIAIVFAILMAAIWYAFALPAIYHFYAEGEAMGIGTPRFTNFALRWLVPGLAVAVALACALLFGVLAKPSRLASILLGITITTIAFGWLVTDFGICHPIRILDSMVTPTSDMEAIHDEYLWRFRACTAPPIFIWVS